MTVVLTTQMEEEIERIAQLRGAIPQNVLRRAIMSYCAKMSEPHTEPSYGNVVSIRGDR